MDLRMTSPWPTKPLSIIPHCWSSSCEELEMKGAHPRPLLSRALRAASTEVVDRSCRMTPQPQTATTTPTMVSSSSVSSVQETSDGDSSHTSSSFAPCDIGLLERLIRTHPIWFLPGIGRAGAVHLLQGKDVGNFIVRQSSKPNTMALSVRLPENKGPYVEHYLIETVGDAQLRLEGSDNNFHAIPMLVAHYCQCCDELPVQLALPRSLAQAVSRQELSSLALLGQDFWLSSLVQSPSSGSPPPGQFPGSSATNSSGQHSTFKPVSEVSKRSGPSPPNTLALNSQQQPSQEMQKDQQSSNLGSPPPPVAPKHQNRGAPPPPPPRSFQSSRSPSCANIAPQSSDLDSSSPELASPANNNEYNGQDDVGTEVLNNASRPSSNEKKTDKKVPRVTHYKQSNIVDLPSKYYKSSLADKISDYEDIWGNSVSKEKKSNLTTFQSSLRKLDSGYMDSLKRKNIEFFRGKHSDDLILAKFKYTYTKGTQTEVPGGKKMQFTELQMVQSEVMGDVALNGRMHNVDNTNHNVVTFNDEITYSPSEEDHFPSPFYSEPVDSLPVDDDDESCMKQTSMFNGELNCLPQRFFNHRFSDPNLHWPQNMSCRKIDTLDEERVGSLSSSVDNIKGLGPSPQHRRQQALGLSTDWVHELHQRVSSHNLLKRDIQTQVSNLDLHTAITEPNQTSSPMKSKSKTPNSSWPLDSSWEWLAHEDSSDDDILSSTLGSKFPLYIKSKHSESHYEDSTTVEDLIALKSPELSLPEIKPLTQSNLMRVSEYDNLGGPPDPQKESHKVQVPEVIDDTATEFSEPWDSLRWERLLRLVIPETDILGDDDFSQQREKAEENRNSILEQNGRNQSEHITQESPGNKFYDSESASTVSAFSDVTSDGVEDTSVSEFPRTTLDRERNKSFQDRLEPLLAAPRITALRNKSTFGDNIRQYIFRLAEERNNTFAMSIENFIQCTKESNETKPVVVMRNIRQFMSGMKNYLVKHGEGHFEQLVQEERSKLKSNEFLNIDAIIEAALHKLVIKPLKSFIYQLFVNEYTRNGSLRLLSDNIKFARTKSPEELGIRPEFKPPEGASFEVVQHFLTRLQQAYSPLRKLENLLAAISTIYNSVRQDNTQSKDHASLAPDDFLPIFIYVLVQCGLLAAEIEADYMWGLLHPSLMYGEAGYYLTTLSSAVHVLKSLQACSPESPQHSQQPFDQTGTFENNAKSDLGSPKAMGCKTTSPEPRLPCIADLQGFMKIMIPDELTGSIIFKTLPVRPNMTTKDVVKMIAHKFNVTNPQDYCLFKLLKGEETLLGDNECPQSIKAELVAAGTDCVFAYKRCDAKFIWPVMENS